MLAETANPTTTEPTETIEDYIKRCADSIRKSLASHGENYLPNDVIKSNIPPESMQVIDLFQHVEDLKPLLEEPDVLLRLLILHSIEGELEVVFDEKFDEAQVRLIALMSSYDSVVLPNLNVGNQERRESELMARAWLIDLCKSEAYSKLTPKELWYIFMIFAYFIDSFETLNYLNEEDTWAVKFLFDGIKKGHLPWDYADDPHTGYQAS
jgi:hypothetical protein